MDDNFISKVPYTKDLLRALVPLHESGELREWSAETTLNVARDEELLDLFRAAGCSTLIIGFESISEATLLAMDKKVNFCLTYQEGIERIHRRGMTIVGNFIVGFDTDTLSVFQRPARLRRRAHDPLPVLQHPHAHAGDEAPRGLQGRGPPRPPRLVALRHAPRRLRARAT